MFVNSIGEKAGAGRNIERPTDITFSTDENIFVYIRERHAQALPYERFIEFGVMNQRSGEILYEKIPYGISQNGCFCVIDSL